MRCIEKNAIAGDLFPLEEVIREAEKTRTREHYLSCLAQDQSAVLQAAVRRPAILHAFRDWLEAFLMESASPDALHTIIQVCPLLVPCRDLIPVCDSIRLEVNL